MKTIYKTKTVTIQVKQLGSFERIFIIEGSTKYLEVRARFSGQTLLYTDKPNLLGKAEEKQIKQYFELTRVLDESCIVRRADIKKGMTFNKIGSKGNVQSKLLIVDKYNYCQSSKKYCSINYNDINDYQEMDGNKLVFTEEFI